MTVAGGERPNTLPDGLVHLRTTPEFDEHSVPSGLLGAHRVAPGVWGLLRVRSGSVDFVFEDGATPPRRVGAGDSQVIPPGDRHHLELVGSVTFVVEFHGSP
jgi:tellurite resistance-related uncharacterized protein